MVCGIEPISTPVATSYLSGVGQVGKHLRVKLDTKNIRFSDFRIWDCETVANYMDCDVRKNKDLVAI